MKCESHFEELVRNGEYADLPGLLSAEGAEAVLRLRHQGRPAGAELRRRRRRLLRRRLRLRPLTRPRRDLDSPSMLDALEDRSLVLHALRPQQSRTQVVFGNGHPNADLMFVGEAPGFHEDQQGIPFVGQAGKLLDKLLAGIGLTRADVYVANTLKCRPPGNRDPLPEEKHQCEPWLFKQIELIKPKVVATSGNHATKQLTGKETGITRVHGEPQQAVYGPVTVTIFPLYHPAAALYTPAMLKVLEEDFAKLPVLLEQEVEPIPSPDRWASPARSRPQYNSVCSDRGRSTSPDETEAVAARLAERLQVGDVVASLRRARRRQDDVVRGACRGARRHPARTSPTYTIGHRYQGRVAGLASRPLPLRAVRRLPTGAALEPYFEDAVVFVEWPEAAGEPVAHAAACRVRLSHVDEQRAADRPATAMLTLAFDTATDVATVALVRDGEVLGERRVACRDGARRRGRAALARPASRPRRRAAGRGRRPGASPALGSGSPPPAGSGWRSTCRSPASRRSTPSPPALPAPCR